MRRARVDRNQPEIVQAFRRLGCQVAHTHTVGHGFPDIVVAVDRYTLLVEIKDPEQPASKRKLTPDEQEFANRWTGDLRIVTTIEEVAEIVEQIRKDQNRGGNNVTF